MSAQLPITPARAREQLGDAREERRWLQRLGARATDRQRWEVFVIQWYAYCDARRAGLDHEEIVRRLGVDARKQWDEFASRYPPPR